MIFERKTQLSLPKLREHHDDAVSASGAFRLPDLPGDFMCHRKRTSKDQRRTSVLESEKDDIRVPWSKGIGGTMDLQFSREDWTWKWYVPKGSLVRRLRKPWLVRRHHHTSGLHCQSVQGQMFLNTAEKVSQSRAHHGLAREEDRPWNQWRGMLCPNQTGAGNSSPFW